MTQFCSKVASVFLVAGAVFLTETVAIDRAHAQLLGSRGDIVEVTFGGKPTKGRIDDCTATSCHLFLYDDVSERWSDGTAFFPKNEIRGLKAPARAIAAPVPAPPQAARPVAFAPARPTRVVAPAPAQRPAGAVAGVRAIPAGHYGCLFGTSGSPGYVDIRGNTYRGPSLDASGGFHAYAMGAGNSITWTGGFGAFKVVSAQFMGGDTSGRPWFAVTYARTRGGGIDRLDCVRE